MKKIGWPDRVKNEEVLQQPRRRGTSYLKYNEERLTGYVTSCVGTAFYKTAMHATEKLVDILVCV
jgi:hypothetical protein